MAKKNISAADNRKVENLVPDTVDSTGEFMTTDQGLKINDDNNSLKAGELVPLCWRILFFAKRSPISIMNEFRNASYMPAVQRRMVISFETIIDDIKKVLVEGSVVTKEIETNNGKWYQIMIMPYVQQADHKNTGAIITFNDITELKKIQYELDFSNEMLGMAIESSEMGTWTIDTKTLEFILSLRLKEMFGFYPDEKMTYEDAIAQIVDEYQSLVTDAFTSDQQKQSVNCNREDSFSFHK